tara:strand:- start:191 stop:982 length:792 start_codon:yes stop_codon:yes gene_type:complete
MDFTITSYKPLLNALQDRNYSFLTFQDFLNSKKEKQVVLRHDVDLLPKNSLRFAKIQASLGIKGTYYFRAVPESWDENIIKEIEALGHEVGYHYENMDTCNGDVDKSWDDFRYHLDKLRKLVEVKTICMHGSPRSKFDNKEIWNKYDYRSLQITGEPYYDVDFDKVFYLTDTGRRWDGWKTSVRDKVPQQDLWVKQGLKFHSTQDIIDTVTTGNIESEVNMPNKIMFTMHPQRWSEGGVPWLKELVLQNLKNQVKKVMISNNS